MTARNEKSGARTALSGTATKETAANSTTLEANPKEGGERLRVTLTKDIDADAMGLGDALATSADYYRREATLVHIETVYEERKEVKPSGTETTLPKGAVTLQTATVDLVRGDLSRIADVYRVNAKGVEMRTEVPADRVRTLLAYTARLARLPIIAGISRVPLIDLKTGELLRPA